MIRKLHESRFTGILASGQKTLSVYLCFYTVLTHTADCMTYESIPIFLMIAR